MEGKAVINPSSIALHPCVNGLILRYEIEVRYGGCGTYDCKTRWDCKQESYAEKDAPAAVKRMRELYDLCTVKTEDVVNDY